jgi:hypothetical protein
MPFLAFFSEANKGNMPGPLHGRRQLALMTQAVARNPARNNAPTLGQKIPQEPDVLEVNGTLFNTKPAGPAPLKKSSAASAAITPSTAAATFTFHKSPFFRYCGSSYS